MTMGIFDIDLDKLVNVTELKRGIDFNLIEKVEDPKEQFTTREILVILSKYNDDSKFINSVSSKMLDGKIDYGVLNINSIIKERSWLTGIDKNNKTYLISDYVWSVKYSYISLDGMIMGGNTEIKNIKQKIRQARLDILGI